MNRISKFEKKFGKYAIHNLSFYLIICYAFGYAINFAGKSNILDVSIMSYLNLNPYAILHGEIWRLFTWILVPPSGFSIFTLIMLYFYYSIGKSLEQVWGAYRFNLYIFSGMFFTVLGSFLLYFSIQFGLFGNLSSVSSELIGVSLGNSFSTYYVNLSIILAFAATFPENQVLLMMIFPIKIKWIGIVYAVIQGYELIIGNVFTKVIIIASLLNFIIFFFISRKKMHISLKQRKRKNDFKRNVEQGNKGPKHRCAVCGRTELDDDDLVFRYCSKCNGNYEYCQEHLFTHEHVN